MASGTAVTETNAVATVPQPSTIYHSPDAERFAMEQRMARVFVTSGLFGDIKGQSAEQSIAQAYVKIALGNSMGFSPAESMQGIDLIQGRPAISAQLRAARMQRAGFSWAPTATDKGCWLAMFYQGKPIMIPRINPQTGEIVRASDGSVALEQAIVSYTEIDARAAGLAGKDNYKKDPSSMYFARAVTRAQRRFAPGVLSGDILSREEAFDVPVDGYEVIAEPRSKYETLPAKTEVEAEALQPITDGQCKRFYAIASESGWQTSETDKLLAANGWTSAKQITRDKYDAIIEALQGGKDS
jgi:hypothetical protein